MDARLGPARQALLDETRALVGEADTAVERVALAAPTRKALRDATTQLAQPFLIVVVGEFNAGKSAFINALVGAPLLEEGVTPTTGRVGILRYGSERSERTLPDGTRELRAPVALLETLAIVDTPGTNAVLREHEALTRDYLPRADLVLFVTSCDRPYTESERAFLAAIRAWGKTVVLVLNKRDLLQDDAELDQVVGFVREQAARTLDAVPEVFPLSARAAQAARARSDTTQIERSGLAGIEARLEKTLDESERFRLKLLNPLGIAKRALQEARELVARSLELLQGDLAALAAIEARLGSRPGELARGFALRVAELEKVLLEFEKRGNAFFDEHLRLGRIRSLLDRERLRRDFEAQAVGALPREIERRVDGVVDFLIEAELGQWQDVMATLAGRPAARDGASSRVDERFARDREGVLEGVSRAARAAVEHFDAAAEGRRLAEKVRESVAQAALLQVSALGLGTLVAALASTTAADVTGILAAGALSLIGLVLLPARRARARRELASRVAALREKLMASLAASFEAERDQAATRVRAAVAPYADFIRRERERLDSSQQSLSSLAGRLESLVARLTPSTPVSALGTES